VRGVLEGLLALSDSPWATACISPWIETNASAETVELALHFALGRFDHERAGDRNDMVGAW